MYKQQQQGFTLIEIAIVLVIIGLLLGGVLKGQEMIENGKIKNVVNDLNGVTAAVNSYRDRYRMLPGDDNAATTRGWAGGPHTNGDASGFIGAAATNPFAAATSENQQFWRHLRASGLAVGNPATTGIGAYPSHAGGGLMGVKLNAYALPGHAICLGNLSGKHALAIDGQLDDGQPNSGSVRSSNFAAGTNGAPTNTAPTITAYDETLAYTLCRAL